jgi:serine/threonine protein kinase
MAPEVFRHEPYNSSVDVYSYSMIAYQLLEFQPPFAGVDPVDAARQAALYDRRPAFINLAAAASAPKAALRALIERCWAPNAEDRPSFPEVVVALEAVLEMLPVRSAPGGGGACCIVS